MYIMAYDDIFSVWFDHLQVFKSYVSCNIFVKVRDGIPFTLSDEYVAWYIAHKGLKMVESDRNMPS